jgi:hypothetical protein
MMKRPHFLELHTMDPYKMGPHLMGFNPAGTSLPRRMLRSQPDERSG